MSKSISSPKVPELSELLSYKHDQVLARFVKISGRPLPYADRLFQEVLKFLWLSQKAKFEKADVKMAVYDEMTEFDDMWHNFILYTDDYTKFCETYFGEYLHHHPSFIILSESSNPTEAPKVSLGDDAILTDEDYGKFFSYVYDHLGPEILQSWFKAPPEEIAAFEALKESLGPLELKRRAFELSYRRFFNEEIPDYLLHYFPLERALVKL